MTEQILRTIVASLQQGVPSEAERLCRHHLGEAPVDENLLFLLALSLQQQGRHEEAAEFHTRLTELVPQSAVHWGNLATALRLAGRLEQAAQAATKAVELAPDEATNHVGLGLVQMQQNNYEGARETLLKACLLDSSSPVAAIHAASVLVKLRDTYAYTLLRPWHSWLPLEDVDLQLQLAHLLMVLGEVQDARMVLNELLRRVPGNVPALIQLAALCERANELQNAESMLADAARISPWMDERARRETEHLQATLAMRHGDLAQARSRLESTGPRDPMDCAHYFDLAGVCDKFGDTQGAMEALAIAHMRQTAELRLIAPARFAAGAPILPNAVGRVSAQDYRSWPRLAAPQLKDSPIFIVGFPRSGTTLLEQMLDAHPELQSMDERPFFTMLGHELREHGLRVPEELHRLDQRDCDELRKRYVGLVTEKIERKWGLRLVDKNPLSMLWLPLIDRLYPKSKMILALRHPCDVVLSNYMQNYLSSVLASACGTLEQTAVAYVAAMEAWLYHVDVFKPDVLVSRYEDLVTDFPHHAQRIASFLDLEDVSAMLRFDQHARDKGFIATPSYTQVIRPINRSGMNRWHRYRREFEQVLPILEPMLRHWNYSIDDA